MNDDKILLRRGMLKATVFGSLAGLFATFNPSRFLVSQKNENIRTVKVKIHPLAVKRNNKDKS